MGKGTWLTIVFIVGIVASSHLLSQLKYNTEATKSHLPYDFYMTGVTYIEYNAQGQVYNQLHASLMRHYTKRDQLYFETPQFLLYNTQRIPWNISAKYAISLDGDQRVNLWDQVHLHQPQEPNHPETTIITSAMTFYPKKSLAQSDRHVKIVRPDSVIYGKGIRANLNRGLYELLSQSRILYKPEDARGQSSNQGNKTKFAIPYF